MNPPSVKSRVALLAWRGEGAFKAGERTVPEETPVALTYDGSTYAVMMATPQDLEDFALGFSLTEGVISHPDEMRSLEILAVEDGVEARMWLHEDRGRDLARRRRRIAGPTGCGLCGVESLAEAAARPPKVVGDARFLAEDLSRAMAALEGEQVLNAQTSAVHAAAFWSAETGLAAVREDVGRHNAVDKVAGALALSGRSAAGGAVLVTSRVSVELVQKAARIGAAALVAVSAPTGLAIRTAEEAGIALAAVARMDGFEIFSHSGRIIRR